MLIILFALLVCMPLSSVAFSADTQPPVIELQDLRDSQTVYTEKIYISGKATDAGKVKTLTVNNESLLSAPGQTIVFSHLAKLDEGKNIITINAGDDEGNTEQKQITVMRETLPLSLLPKAVIDNRMRIAVYPFEHNKTVSDESGIFMDLFTLAIENQNRFQLTDRALMDRILEEQKLSLTKLIDQDAAVKIGKIMSAQAIVTGSIIETGTGTEMVGRMIDTETSEIIATQKIFSRKKELDAFEFLAESMALQFHNDFPMVRGVVIKRNDRHVFTDLGRSILPVRATLLIYRENDPAAYNTILGYARVIQVLPEMSKAELIKGDPEKIRPLDWVVLQ